MHPAPVLERIQQSQLLLLPIQLVPSSQNTSQKGALFFHFFFFQRWGASSQLSKEKLFRELAANCALRVEAYCLGVPFIMP